MNRIRARVSIAFEALLKANAQNIIPVFIEESLNLKDEKCQSSANITSWLYMPIPTV